jgi:hypothetical protein
MVGRVTARPTAKKSKLYTVLKLVDSGLDPMAKSYTLLLPSDIGTVKLRNVSTYRTHLLQNMRK